MKTPRIIILALSLPLLLLPLVIVIADDLHGEGGALLFVAYIFVVLLYEWYLFSTPNSGEESEFVRARKLAKKLSMLLVRIFAIALIVGIIVFFWINQKVETSEVQIVRSGLFGDTRTGDINYYYAELLNNTGKSISKFVVRVSIIDTLSKEVVNHFFHTEYCYSPLAPDSLIKIIRENEVSSISGVRYPLLSGLPSGIGYKDTLMEVEVYTKIGDWLDW
jgi:hypothetical protein